MMSEFNGFPDVVNDAIAVVYEIKLRIANAKAQIDDIRERGESEINSERIKRREFLIEVFESILALEAQKSIDTETGSDTIPPVQ